MKLVVTENESQALSDAVAGWRHTTCELAVIEVARAAGRAHGARETRARVDALFAEIDLIVPTGEVVRRAREVAPTMLRSLDAIHLATALSLGESLGAFATYDRRLADAARDAGLDVVAPGAR
ncbi:MAG: PIN domain-containing protein [Thermoleophilaceae bacterium]|nr:PIN domain-containing protein [Thermoleophilaceae bacterium]